MEQSDQGPHFLQSLASNEYQQLRLYATLFNYGGERVDQISIVNICDLAIVAQQQKCIKQLFCAKLNYNVHKRER